MTVIYLSIKIMRYVAGFKSIKCFRRRVTLRMLNRVLRNLNRFVYREMIGQLLNEIMYIVRIIRWKDRVRKGERHLVRVCFRLQ